MADVTKVLDILQVQTPELAAIGLAKLYTKMEENGELKNTDMFQLLNFVSHLTERVKTVDLDTANALKFRIHGLVTAIDGCIKSIWKLWISDPFASTRRMLDAVSRFPEHVEICSLVSKVSTSMTPEQAVKLSQELIAKLPIFSQRMQGFKQLFECMKNRKQLETCEFMTVVYLFKGVISGSATRDDDIRLKSEAMGAIPEFIQNVFFPRNTHGYCSLYACGRGEYLRFVAFNDKGDDEDEWLHKFLLDTLPLSSRTVIFKHQSVGCKLELRSFWKNNQVQFVIVTRHPNGEEERFLTCSSWANNKGWDEASCRLNFELPVCKPEEHAAYRYYLKPNGLYLTIRNVGHGGLLTLDPWELAGYEPSIFVKSCKAIGTKEKDWYSRWEVKHWDK